MLGSSANVALSLTREISRRLTGRLLTEQQIQPITENIVGQHFSEFFPTPQKDIEAQAQISAAKLHITEASEIISSLQKELDKQVSQLDSLSKEITERKKDAERYEELSKAGQNTFSAFNVEMERTVRKELIEQAEKGKHVRRLISFVTLVFGAVLGAILPYYIDPQF